MSKTPLSELKNLSEKDRAQLEQVEELLGPDAETMGFAKGVFWGRIPEDLVFPYPEVSPDENARLQEVLKKLDDYLEKEHPHVEVDLQQKVPDWCIRRLFETGVMGMAVPEEYGGGGLKFSSYVRAIERIGRTCASTAVLVSAHESMCCCGLSLFGTPEQKRQYLPLLASERLGAFCLSEPNVGSDAGGQETRCELSEDGQHYVLDGEKKWVTSGALAGVLFVTAKQRLTRGDGKVKDGVTALVCTPDMDGIEVFSRNRSKCGIRGTWQARIRFNKVKVPRENLLHGEGKGLNYALSSLDYGRCTLAAGALGAAKRAQEQAAKWAQYRYQFQRPLREFEQIQEKIARMASYCYAMDAMLYMTAGMIDRGDEDIMLETAICKLLCSELSFRTVDEAMQIMGGEGYMTENVVERLWRDSRINIIVEGANEVMNSFVFGYGSKQLVEHLLEVKNHPLQNLTAAAQIAAELWLGRGGSLSDDRLHPDLRPLGRRLDGCLSEFRRGVLAACKEHKEKLITRQMIQARLSTCVSWIYALTCSLSRLDSSVRSAKGREAVADEILIVEHLCAVACEEVTLALRALRENTDSTMVAAADAALRQADRLPNAEYSIPEKTPDATARGTGRAPNVTDVPQFGPG